MSQEASELRDDIEDWTALRSFVDELILLNQLAMEEEDFETAEEITLRIEEAEQRVSQLESVILFNEPYDRRDAIVTINAGAGGTDACDWVDILQRMYMKWANARGYEVQPVGYMWGDEAGFRWVEFIVHGRYAYGHLRTERGVHRLIRLSPFDFSGKRHTSFASVDVIPVFDEEIDVAIDPKDLKIDTFRASGPGGQHVNVTDSAVRITHIPTGITAVCQEGRSQLKNKETAMMVLAAKLHEHEERKRQQELDRLRGEKKEIAWGSQIRTYTMHAYNLVKDHRTDLEEPRVQEVLEGKIDEFIYGYLRQKARDREAKDSPTPS